MSNALSHRQFAEYVAANGGGSRRLIDGTIGPSEGYYVSRNPDVPVAEGGSREWVRTGLKDVGRHVNRHWNRVRDEALAATPEHLKSEVYQGAWVSEKDSAGTSDSYLDVSDRHDGVMDAAFAAVRNKQKAIFNANTGTDINVWNGDRTKWSAAGVADEVKRRIRSI